MCTNDVLSPALPCPNSAGAVGATRAEVVQVNLGDEMVSFRCSRH